MPVRYITTASGAQTLTLNQFIAAPTAIAERFVAMVRDQFVMEKILRGPIPAPGGAVQFRVSSGMFADQASEIVNPRAEIPLATISRGILDTAATRPHALAVGFDWDFREKDVIGEVNRQLEVVKNTIVRDIDGAFLTTALAKITQTRTATAAWNTGGATIRKDISAAKLLINQAVTPQGTSQDFLAYRANTIVVNPVTETDLFNSTEFLQMLFGQINPTMSAGDLSQIPGGKIMGLTPWVSPSIPAGKALICEAKTVGFYADRVPLGMSELYDWNPARLSRADAFRETVAGIDQPSAGAWLQGI